MTEKEFEEYNKTAENIQSEAVKQLLNDTVEKIRKQNKQQLDRAASVLRPEVEKNVNEQPEVKALDLLRTGKLKQKQVKSLILVIILSLKRNLF